MLPTTVTVTMNRLCEALEARLPGFIEAAYVYGSVALGAYIERSSDIDFIVIVRERPGAGQLRAMEEAHAEVEERLPGTDMMGAYVVHEQLGRQPADNDPVPAYFERRLHIDGKKADLNPVTWRILKSRGIRVYGTDVPFEFETPAEQLADYVLGNMNSYWAGQIERLTSRLEAIRHSEPGSSAGGVMAAAGSADAAAEAAKAAKAAEADIPAPLLDRAVEWCVLGMLRQLYTLREGGITSKIGAGEYGLSLLPARWHNLVREALAVKRREPERLYWSQSERLGDLVELLQYIRAECNRPNG